MKIAVAGKGGSGKTTIAGTLARALADAGHTVLAIDADLNPNLAPTLGVPKEQFDAGTPLPRDILEHRVVEGRETVALSRPLAEILDAFALDAPSDIRLLTMGRPEEAGFG
ncbi:MAG: AAA family ATPase [Actinomycetota bacterium]|nr:AAA family ATPase [Actinomycetota bacterium]